MRAFVAIVTGVALAASSPAEAEGARAPAAGTIVIGRSVRGRTLRARNVGARHSATRVLVVGSIHGNERAGEAVVHALRRRERRPAFELWVVRRLNPDGARANTRQNARGVDLNRNWGRGWRPGGRPWDTYYPGGRPWSEPETRAARRFVARLRPDVTVWYHQHMALVTRMKRHVPVQRRYARLVGLPLVKLDPLPGTATRWQNHRRPGHTAFVVELPAGSLGPRAARRHARAVIALGRFWIRRTRRRRS